MTYFHPLCKMSIAPPILRYSYFKIWPRRSMVKVLCVVKGQGHVSPTKFKSQGYGQGQTHWSHLRPGVQSICLLFVLWQSNHVCLRYSKFYIWPWKFKVKVMAKVKSDGHIWALDFNRYVRFSFLNDRTIVGWDIANSIFYLEKSRSRSRSSQGQGRPKSNQVFYRSGLTIVPKMKEIRKVVQKLSFEQNLRPPAAAYEPVQKHKVTPGIPGWLNKLI